jgi:four helix bundle protein
MENNRFRFEELEAWKQARQSTQSIYPLCKMPDLNRDYGLTNQIQKARVSVMSNLAEGYERLHPNEKLQFYNIARGSNAEVRSLLYVVEDNFPEAAQQSIQLRARVNSVGRLISGLITSTRSRTQ